MTLKEVYLKCIQDLKDGGIEFAKFEASQIVEHFCSVTKHDILAKGEKKIDPFTIEKIEDAVKSRLTSKPLQYILGCWDFYGNTYQVGKGVLIPRSDTEVLVDSAIQLLKEKENPTVLDLCSGSGCIAASIFLNTKNCDVYAVELSDTALEYLKSNNKTLCNDQLTVIHDDVITYCPDMELDLIASNPPYLTKEEMNALQKEVQHEPSMALVAKENGLYFYKVISERYYNYLKNGGYLVFEVGYTQANSVKTLLEQNDYKNIQIVKDLSGVDRVVIGQKIV